MAQKFGIYVQEDADKMTFVKTIDVGVIRQCIPIPIGFVRVNMMIDKVTFQLGDSREVLKEGKLEQILGKENESKCQCLDGLTLDITDYTVKQEKLKVVTDEYMEWIDKKVFKIYGYHAHSKVLAAQKLRSIIKTTLGYNKGLH